MIELSEDIGIENSEFKYELLSLLLPLSFLSIEPSGVVGSEDCEYEFEEQLLILLITILFVEPFSFSLFDSLK